MKNRPHSHKSTNTSSLTCSVLPVERPIELGSQPVMVIDLLCNLFFFLSFIPKVFRFLHFLNPMIIHVLKIFVKFFKALETLFFKHFSAERSKTLFNQRYMNALITFIR